MEKTRPTKFHLSVVATSRNDNHGGSLTKRMQHFVDGFVAQCVRHCIQAELILVEWNPPKETIPLAEVLKFPDERGPCEIRIITVPPELHHKLKHSENLPLFQMIAKNIGIRRALGDYVLATNIDILFSDEIMKFIKSRLQEDYLYRADRLDIPPELPENVSFKKILNFAEKKAFRINNKNGTFFKKKIIILQYILQLNKKILQIIIELLPLHLIIHYIVRKIIEFSQNIFKMFLHISNEVYNHYKKVFTKLFINMKKFIRKFKHNNILHTNACGDFTLLSKKQWEALRGYPEWEIFSWHLDSVLLHQAYFNRIPQVNLPNSHCIYHIEHSPGSGFTPEYANLLFTRLKKQNIEYINNDGLDELISNMSEKTKKGEKVFFNGEDWGWRDIPLKEQWV